MEQNLTALKQAAVLYPIFALLFTLPYMAYNYRKYGSVFSLRIAIVYSLMLYLLCVYCLVILPLPTGQAAAQLRGHKMQLVPFKFVKDMVRESKFVWTQPATWPSLVTNSAFLTAVLNVLMTLPFGIYLRYYFRCGWRKTLILSFLLSLFFELTQLSGLYFIYPGSYRLFDVDDLMMNTLGGMLGYGLARPLTAWLPDRDALDSASFVRGRHVSLLRRLLALGCDGVTGALLCGALSLFMPFRWALWSIPAYFCLCPMLLRGQTLGLRWMRIRIECEDSTSPRWVQYWIRYGSLILTAVWLPARLNLMVVRAWGTSAPLTMMVCFGIINGGYLFWLLFEGIRLGMHKPLFHERLSGTHLVSLISGPEGTSPDSFSPSDR